MALIERRVLSREGPEVAELLQKAGGFFNVHFAFTSGPADEDVRHLDDRGWTVRPDTVPDSTPRSLVRGPVLTTRRLVVAHRAGSIVDPAVDELADRIRRASS